MLVAVHLERSLAGLLIGLLMGMTGMGDGSLLTPMLVFAFGFKPIGRHRHRHRPRRHLQVLRRCGTFFGLTMMLFFPISMAQIVGTDIVHVAALL
jgi:uncharacterized membrane protein YfcA